MCDIFNFLWNQGEHIFLWKEKQNFCIIPAGITCSKSTIEVLEQRIKYVQSQENHTREGGTHLRISFWHLLMNFEKKRKIRILKKWKKKLLEISSLYTCVPKTIIISYEVQFLRYGVRQKFLVILGHFLPFTPLPPLTTQKTKILKKWKKHLEMSSF